MYRRSCQLVFATVLVSSVGVAILAQVRLDPHSVELSPLIDRLLEIKRDDPDLSPERFAETADGLLQKLGINFQFSLDQTTCAKLLAEKSKQKDPNAPVKLTGSLKSIGGERASLEFPEPSFHPTECGGCYITLPLLEARRNDLVTVVRERNVRFELPSNFFSERMFLVDSADINAVKQEWRVPKRMEPIGVTHEETVVFLSFVEPELADLSLLVYDTGNFRIGTRADAEEGGIGKIFNPGPGVSETFEYRTFERWTKKYVVLSKPPCNGQTLK